MVNTVQEYANKEFKENQEANIIISDIKQLIDDYENDRIEFFDFVKAFGSKYEELQEKYKEIRVIRKLLDSFSKEGN